MRAIFMFLGGETFFFVSPNFKVDLVQNWSYYSFWFSRNGCHWLNIDLKICHRV
jgi:hypothetical protein